MDERGKRSLAVVTLGAVLSVVPQVPPAEADLVVAGTCDLTVTMAARPLVSMPVPPTSVPPTTMPTTPPLSVVSATTTSVDGTGWCDVVGDSGGPYEGTLDTLVTSALGTNTFGCLVGVATGTGTFTLDKLGFPGNLTLNVAVTVSGVMTVTGVEVPRFVGTGVFKPTQGQATACTTGPTGITWTGTFLFEDPEV